MKSARLLLIAALLLVGFNTQAQKSNCLLDKDAPKDLVLDYASVLSEAEEARLRSELVAFDDSVNMLQQARFSMEFCVEESCGKCTPCRIGSVRGVEVIDKIKNKQEPEANIELLHSLCDTMENGSLCAMGGMTPFPVRSALEHFQEDFV